MTIRLGYVILCRWLRLFLVTDTVKNSVIRGLPRHVCFPWLWGRVAAPHVLHCFLLFAGIQAWGAEPAWAVSRLQYYVQLTEQIWPD